MTKAMVAGAERLDEARGAPAYGVTRGEVTLDFAAFMARKDAVTAQLRDGVAQLLKARRVEVMAGRGRLAGPGKLALDDGRALEGDAVILASGSEPVHLSLFDCSDPRVMTSDELLVVDHVPASLAIGGGGGVIGCEFASVFARLGGKVTVVEMLDQLLPGEDKRTGRTLQTAFKKAGVEISAQGFVVTDDTMRTSVDGVFPAGDVAGPPLLAHWAYHQGRIAAENAVTGSRIPCARRIIPSCVFSSPEVASFGLTEDRAAAEGREVQVAHVRFNGNSKAVVDGDADGYVRIVCEPGGGPVLGASLVGPHVSELVHELALAAHAGLALGHVMETIHAHPTLSETVGEAALSGVGRGVHSL